MLDLNKVICTIFALFIIGVLIGYSIGFNIAINIKGF
jgi:VIT1/CCC1 family predicted Fe2+/Mn2+ transporter